MSYMGKQQLECRLTSHQNPWRPEGKKEQNNKVLKENSSHNYIHSENIFQQ